MGSLKISASPAQTPSTSYTVWWGWWAMPSSHSCSPTWPLVSLTVGSSAGPGAPCGWVDTAHALVSPSSAHRLQEKWRQQSQPWSQNTKSKVRNGPRVTFKKASKASVSKCPLHLCESCTAWPLKTPNFINLTVIYNFPLKWIKHNWKCSWPLHVINVLVKNK